jgi:hypothetical protein
MELKDLNKLRFSCEVLYNNTICKVYGLCGPMPDKNPYYNDKATVTLWCNGLITVALDDVTLYKE